MTDIDKVLARLAADRAFRAQLVHHPKATLADYHLTADELLRIVRQLEGEQDTHEGADQHSADLRTRHARHARFGALFSELTEGSEPTDPVPDAPDPKAGPGEGGRAGPGA